MLATNCANPQCNVELTDSNRLRHRRVCRGCWTAQKRALRKLSRQVDVEADPTLKQRKKTAFLDELLRNGGFVERAIRKVHTSRRFINDEYNTDPNFARLWNTIIELGNEAIESEIYRRAVTGTEKPLTHQGRLTGDSVHEWSDALIMFLAKARMPQKYRDLPQKGELSEEEINARLDVYLTKRRRKTGDVEMVM